MSCRLVKPEAVRLDLSQGDWLLVRRRLSAGEERRMFARMRNDGATPDKLNPFMVAPARTLAYLLDWSMTDFNDLPINIRGETDDMVLSALDQLDPDTAREINKAVQDHEDREDALRAAEKKTPSGETSSSVTSPSPASMAGAMSG